MPISGPGFDSVGVAVTKYLQIEVCEEERDEWLIEHQIGKWIPHDERNLLLKIALQIAPTATETLENDQWCSLGVVWVLLALLSLLGLN